EYHNLHGTYGSGDTFDKDYTYTLNQDEIDAVEGSIKVWTEKELLTLLGAGLLVPVTDTTIFVENANITGANVTIVASNGSVGNASGQEVIDVTSTPLNLTDAQRVILSAAERTDISYLSTDLISAQ